MIFISMNVQCVKGAGKSSSIGVLHVGSGFSCCVETFLSRD